MSEEWLTLAEVFRHADRLPRGLSLYLPAAPWSLETRGVLLDPDHGEADENDIPFAVENKLRRTLSMADIIDVLKVARGQDSNAAQEEFLEAFVYYWEHDSFLDRTTED